MLGYLIPEFNRYGISSHEDFKTALISFQKSKEIISYREFIERMYTLAKTHNIIWALPAKVKYDLGLFPSGEKIGSKNTKKPKKHRPHRIKNEEED